MPDSKPELNVMVVFASRYGVTEKLALAAGVGAVQARANIRLRRLNDLTAPEEIARDARWSESLERMQPDYIAPREIDAEWAHVVILAAPLEEVAEPEALTEMVEYLASCTNGTGKTAIVLTPSRELLGSSALAGFTVIPPPREGFADTAAIKAFGKQSCEIVRRMRTEAKS